MRLALALVGGLSVLYGQNCVPQSLIPGGGYYSGTLDATSCVLSDGTAYASYALTLPQRGQLQLSVTPADGSLGLILRDSTGAQMAAGATIQRPVEAGSYTILVNAGQAGQLSVYMLQSAFTAAPGMWCTAFPNLGINQTVSGSLGSSGCAAPDGTAYEAYWVNTLGAGTLAASVSSAALNATVTVRDNQGNPLASGANNVTAPVAADGQYQVVVALVDNTGPYQLSTSFQPAATETCLPQQTFTGSGQDTNAITATSCFTAVDDYGDFDYYNYYLLTVPGGGLAEVSAAGTNFQPTLYLLDAAGNQLAMDSGGAGNGNADIRMQLAAGSYLVELASGLTPGGGYTFNYSFTAGNPQPCQPVTLALPSAASTGSVTGVSGAVSAASCRTSLGLADVYSITLPSAGMLSANLTAGAFTSQVAIHDAKDGLIALNEDVNGQGASSVSALLPAGTYTIVAAAATGSGAYQLTPGFTQQAIPACSQAASLPPNSSYVQNVGGSGCFSANGQPADLYQFTLPADSVVAAFMTSSQVAGLLTLTDAGGNFLRSDADSYSANDPMVVQFLKAGTYQLAARAAAAGASGIYQLTLLAASASQPPFCTPLATVAAGSTVSGSLSYTSCQYDDSTFADLYQVSLSAPATVDVLLASSAFDAYLVLLDAKGNVVAQDDDSGGGTNAEIVQALAAGTYFVVAKPVSYYYSVGSYQLTVSY